MSTPLPEELSDIRALLARLTAMVESHPANDVGHAPPPRPPKRTPRRIDRTDDGQLVLSLFPETHLRGCLDAYMDTIAAKLASATLSDYRARQDWLCRMFGDSTPIANITYVDVEKVIKVHGPKTVSNLKLVTLRKRIRLLRAALWLQLDRGNIEKLWKMPRQLGDDGVRGGTLYTVAEYSRLREGFKDGPQRRLFDLSFWSGMHTYDLIRTTRGMINPDYEWRDSDGVLVGQGAYLRRNHKNRRCVDVWFPMEPELREIAAGWLRDNPAWSEHEPIAHVRGLETGTKVLCRMMRTACKLAELPYGEPNRSMRRSFATMIGDRHHDDPEHLRLAMAHEGRMTISRENGQTTVATHRPTMDTTHYLGASRERLTNSVKRAASR